MQSKGSREVYEARFNEIVAVQSSLKRSDGAGNLLILLARPKLSAQGRQYRQMPFQGIPAVEEVQQIILQGIHGKLPSTKGPKSPETA
jgi:hypothetical protein